MVQLAVRQLHADPLRSALTMAAIAAVIAVILVLRGFEQGLYQQSRDAVLGRGADLFVVQSGVQNFVAVRSSLRQLARRDVEEVPGVAEAHPITSFSVIYEKDSRKVPIYLMVYDKAGGPGRLVEGHAARSARSVWRRPAPDRGPGLHGGAPWPVRQPLRDCAVRGSLRSRLARRRTCSRRRSQPAFRLLRPRRQPRAGRRGSRSCQWST